jgi:hypothetical protein
MAQALWTKLSLLLDFDTSSVGADQALLGWRGRISPLQHLALEVLSTTRIDAGFEAQSKLTSSTHSTNRNCIRTSSLTFYSLLKQVVPSTMKIKGYVPVVDNFDGHV